MRYGTPRCVCVHATTSSCQNRSLQHISLRSSLLSCAAAMAAFAASSSGKRCKLRTTTPKLYQPSYQQLYMASLRSGTLPTPLLFYTLNTHYVHARNNPHIVMATWRNAAQSKIANVNTLSWVDLSLMPQAFSRCVVPSVRPDAPDIITQLDIINFCDINLQQQLIWRNQRLHQPRNQSIAVA